MNNRNVHIIQYGNSNTCFIKKNPKLSYFFKYISFLSSSSHTWVFYSAFPLIMEMYRLVRDEIIIKHLISNPYPSQLQTYSFENVFYFSP